MALGVGAIVFGFLDNFGMKLGTGNLDDNFLQMFYHLSPKINVFETSRIYQTKFNSSQ